MTSRAIGPRIRAAPNTDAAAASATPREGATMWWRVRRMVERTGMSFISRLVGPWPHRLNSQARRRLAQQQLAMSRVREESTTSKNTVRT